MPGFLYESYCHEDLDAVAAQVNSVLVYPDSWVPNGDYGTNPLTGRIRFNRNEVDERIHFFPVCESPGYLPYLPGTVADFVPLWVAGLGVLVIAYAVRMAKLSLGQGRS